MSQPESSAPLGRPGGYQRSSSGLLAALIVTVVAVVAVYAFNALKTDHPTTPVRAVDYAAAVRGARSAGELPVLAPASLPRGWKATSARFAGGPEPTWHLGVLTAQGDYLGVEEARSTLTGLVTTYVDENAEPGRDVVVGSQTWRTWTDPGGDYALGRTTGSGSSAVSTLVVGTAPAATVRSFVATLRAGPVTTGG